MAQVDFEERADQLSLDQIDNFLADGEFFRAARKKLLGRGAKLLVGPRGTGKTHLMRYAYSHTIKTPSAPMAVYVSFNRYLHLEPLLKKTPDALKRFHSWVLARLLLGVIQFIKDCGEEPDFLSRKISVVNEKSLLDLVFLLERNEAGDIYESFGKNITINHVVSAINIVCDNFKRPRAVLLLDDAALSLADQYLVSFFEVFRLLKVDKISPKASVYPGTTQYGPTFHASHEVEEIPLWLSVDDASYSQIMGNIANRRLFGEQQADINPDVLELFKYVAFGIPRVFLRLLREYFDEGGKTTQQKVNKIIKAQTSLIGAEYDSLAIKVRQFSTVISVGRQLFDQMVVDVSETQKANLSKRNIVLGIRQEENRSPLTDRMLKFLIEVGLIYPLDSVSHGNNRKYDRYIPHLAFLYEKGAFREGRNAAFSNIKNVMSAASVKHPIRRDIGSLVSRSKIEGLKLDLPPCSNCGARRINDSQKFCHECGARLVAASLFEESMKLPLSEVPGISEALIRRISRDTSIRNVGHVIASQNPLGDLQGAHYVGPVRAASIMDKVSLVVEEFLS